VFDLLVTSGLGCCSGRRKITRHHKGEALLIIPSTFFKVPGKDSRWGLAFWSHRGLFRQKETNKVCTVTGAPGLSNTFSVREALAKAYKV